MKKVLYSYCSILLFFMGPVAAAGAAARPAGEITVSAAISLKDVFQEIGKLFTKSRPGMNVIFNFGASGDLARQIEGGAPVDAYAAASQKDMEEIDGKGLIIPDSRADFASNSIVLVKPSNSAVPLKSLSDLQMKTVQKIAIGNPRTVPAGRYAEQVLRHLGLWQQIKEKVVFGEHVRQVLDYVARNEVDAGFVYATDALTRSNDVTRVLAAPENSHDPIVYPIGIVKGTKKESLSQKFIDFVRSAESRMILSRYGFGLPGPKNRTS